MGVPPRTPGAGSRGDCYGSCVEGACLGGWAPGFGWRWCVAWLVGGTERLSRLGVTPFSYPPLMGDSKRKGGIAESAVIRTALERGYRVAIPFGEDAPYDLIVDRNGVLEKVQCKYVESNGEFIVVRCRSTNSWSTLKYTAADVDWIATFDATTDACYFVPSSILDSGRAVLHLRLAPTRNNQVQGVRLGADFLTW